MNCLQSKRTRTTAGPGARTGVAALLAAAAALLSTPATACPSCYGASSGPVIDGMNLAVIVMIGITGGVCSWIVAFAVRIVRRERDGAR
jgi:heme/copper-type cytochrome/quinol oxidase subunit 2